MSTELNPLRPAAQPLPTPLTPERVATGTTRPPSIPARPTRAERKAATRKRILAAAREVFFRDGFMDTSLDEVASLASIGKGTLYRHFESKAELYVAVLLENASYFEHKLNKSIDPNGGAIDQIVAFGEFYRAFWTEHPNYFQIFWAIHNQPTIGDLPETLLAQVKELWERPLRSLEQVIRKGIQDGELRACDPWVMANVVWSMGNSGLEAIVSPKKTRLVDCSPDTMYDTGVELLINGLKS